MGVPEVTEGWVSTRLAEEFPDLRLPQLVLDAGRRRSGPSIKRRLSVMSDRFTGGKAITLRLEPVPSSYRSFFRQVGVDPDDRRPPVEELALRRMREGAYLSRGRVEDARTIAVAETGVAVLAFDAAAVSGPLGLRLSRREEPLGAEGRTLPGGQIVVADGERRPVSVLLGDSAPGAEVTRRTKRVLLAALGVEGVPSLTLDEALWIAAGTISEGS